MPRTKGKEKEAGEEEEEMNETSPQPVKTKKRKRQKEVEEEQGGEEEQEEQRSSPVKRRRRFDGEKPSFESGKGKLDEEVIRIWHNRMESSQQSGLTQNSEAQETALLEEKVRSVSQKELLSYINKCANQGGDTTPQFMKAIFLAIPASGETMEQGKELRVAVLELLIWLILYGALEERRAKDCVNTMLGEMDVINDFEYVEVVELLLKGISQAQSSDVAFLDFLPKVLAGIERLQSVDLDNSSTMTGTKYKSYILGRICDTDWSIPVTIPFITVCREIPMTSEDLTNVFNKVFSMLAQIDLQELPSLFYQLLLLSTKGQTEHKSLLLRTIATHLETISRILQQKEQSEKENHDLIMREQIALRHVEGTTLIHLSFAIKQDQELGKAFLRVFNKESFPLTSFTVALLLSMARIQRFEESALEAIKNAVVNFYRESSNKDVSIWYLMMKKRLPDILPVETAIMETVRHSAYGWEHITQSLVQLGVMLIESSPAPSSSSAASAAAAVPAHPTNASSPPTGVTSAASYSTLVIELGINVLLETFRIHEMVRSAILEQIFSHVVTSKAWHVIHFVNLLARLVKECKPLLLELGKGGENYISKIKENFDYLSELSPSISHALLEAVQPIMAVNQAFQDHIVLVLRKSMFSRELESRITGLLGFLNLLLGCSSHAPVTPQQAEGTKNLCFEIIGFLRRCMSQQWEIRERLYQGLVDVFKTSQYPEVREVIFDMLLHQFLNYYEVDTSVSPPLHFERCIEISNSAVAVKKMEPFPSLLNAIQECVFCYSRILSQKENSEAMDDDEDNFKSFVALREHLDVLVERLAVAELEEFELDKSSDYKTTTSIGLFHNEAAVLLRDTYESAIDWVVLKTQPTQQTLTLISKLHSQLVRLKNEAKEAGATNAGDAADAANGGGEKKKKDKEGGDKKVGRRPGTKVAVTQEKKQKKTYLSMNCILGLIQTMTEGLDDDEVKEEKESMSERAKTKHMLRKNIPFCLFFLNAGAKWLKQINDANNEDPEIGRRSGSIQTVHIKFCEKLSPSLLHEFVSTIDFDRQGGQDKLVPITTLECLEMAFKVLVKHKTPKRMAAFLESFVPTVEEEEEEDEETENVYKRDRADPEYLIHRNILKMKALLIKMIEDKKYKEADMLRQIIELLMEYLLLPKCVEGILPQHVRWLEHICKTVQLENVALAKSLISLYFKISRFLPKLHIVPHFIADILVFFGELNESQDSTPAPKTRRYAIINDTTATSVVSAIISILEGYFDEVEHFINIVSSLADEEEIYSDDDDDEEELAKRKDRIQKAIYLRITELVTTSHDLFKCAVPGACREQVFKFMTRIYKVFCTATSQILAAKKSPSSEFAELIEFTGIELSTTAYDMVLTGHSKEKEISKGKVKKELNTVPNLIFAIERYEGLLIKLGKACKLDLMKNFRRSTARDFRIQSDVVLQRKTELADAEMKKAKKKAEQKSSQNSQQQEKPKGKGRGRGRGQGGASAKSPKKTPTGRGRGRAKKNE